MDPKTLSSLDPKLRETYERVMGTSSSTPSTPASPTPTSTPASPLSSTPAPSATQPFPPSTPASFDAIPSTPPAATGAPIPPPSTTAPSSTVNPLLSSMDSSSIMNGQPSDISSIQPNLSTITLSSPIETNTQLNKPLQPLPSPSSINQANLTAKSSPSATIRILYIFAAIIFFVIYTIFWLKILNYPLPFNF